MVNYISDGKFKDSVLSMKPNEKIIIDICLIEGQKYALMITKLDGDNFMTSCVKCI